MGDSMPMTKVLNSSRVRIAISLVLVVALVASLGAGSVAAQKSDSESNDAPGGTVSLDHQRSYQFYFWSDSVEMDGEATADYDGSNTPDDSVELEVEAGMNCVCVGQATIGAGDAGSTVTVDSHSNNVQYTKSVDGTSEEVTIDYAGPEFNTGVGVWTVYQKSTAIYDWEHEKVVVSDRI